MNTASVCKNKMTYKEFRFLVEADLHRLNGKVSFRQFIKHLVFGEGFKYIFWMRACQYSKDSPLLFPIYPFMRLALRHVTYKLGISIPHTTRIGSGFYIGHFGGIVVNYQCVIGRNCNISHGVTLGQSNRGNLAGTPIIGDCVYIGPGATILGAVTIGDNVAIGANCVVTKDVPEGAVVVGNPGRIVSYKGSAGYVNHTDYEHTLKKRTKTTMDCQ